MTHQIAVRLPEELVGFLDEMVNTGRAHNRTAAVTTALERERRRELAARDAAILIADNWSDDFDDLAAFAAKTKIDLQ